MGLCKGEILAAMSAILQAGLQMKPGTVWNYLSSLRF